MVSSIGRKGSLALMWHNDIDLKIVNFSNNHISFEIRLDNMGTKCVLIESYGSPETYKRAAFKDFLDWLNLGIEKSLCVFGDFNEITSLQDEKVGGKICPRRQMEEFKLAL